MIKISWEKNWSGNYSNFCRSVHRSVHMCSVWFVEVFCPFCLVGQSEQSAGQDVSLGRPSVTTMSQKSKPKIKYSVQCSLQSNNYSLLKVCPNNPFPFKSPLFQSDFSDVICGQPLLDIDISPLNSTWNRPLLANNVDNTSFWQHVSFYLKPFQVFCNIII